MVAAKAAARAVCKGTQAGENAGSDPSLDFFDAAGFAAG